MRVIAGSAGGIPLKTPKTELRPTMDMVRGAIFSSLGDKVLNARILDLFSGTGSLGIEALSRGASSALLVEADRKAYATIQENLARTRLHATVLCQDVFRFLHNHSRTAEMDLIFADPPYAKQPGDRDFSSELLTHHSLPSLIAADGIFILEVGRSWKLPQTPLWECFRRKKYGSTETLFFRKATVYAETEQQTPS